MIQVALPVFANKTLLEYAHSFLYYWFHNTVRLSSWVGEDCMTNKLLSGPLRKSMSSAVLDSHLFFITVL